MLFTKIKDVVKGLKSMATGLGITGRALSASKVTVIYPQEQVNNLTTYRGPVELIGKEDARDVPKCVACGVCAKACPSGCLSVLCPVLPKEGDVSSDRPKLGPAPQKGSKAPARFTLDFSRCSLCGQCVKACSHDALRYSNNPYMVSFDRNQFHMDLIVRLRAQAASSTIHSEAENSDDDRVGMPADLGRHGATPKSTDVSTQLEHDAN
jgi:NADH-quinone oxidoreductase subunit I